MMTDTSPLRTAVLVTPEYNHSTSAALKNALDHLYAEWKDKACGAARTARHWRA